MPRRHELIALLDIGEAGRKALQLAYGLQPSSYEELISIRGLGPKRIRALALDIRTHIQGLPKLERSS